MIVYVHGYMAPHRIMALLRRRMKAQGLDGVLFAYRSTRAPIRAHAADLNRFLDKVCPPGEPLWIVGHSLGGIVGRIAHTARPRPELAGTLFLATPNQGCLSARRVPRVAALHRLLGPVASELAAFPHSFLDDIGPLPCPAGVIAGGVGNNRGFRPDLPGDNDGVIRVSETMVPEATERAVLRVRHNMLPFSAKVAELAVAYIRTGTFRGVPGVLRLDHGPGARAAAAPGSSSPISLDPAPSREAC